jgi:hypothetical protein
MPAVSRLLAAFYLLGLIGFWGAIILCAFGFMISGSRSTSPPA